MGWRSDGHSPEPLLPHLAYSVDATLNVHGLFLPWWKTQSWQEGGSPGLSTSALGNAPGRSTLFLTHYIAHLSQRNRCCSKTVSHRVSKLRFSHFHFSTLDNYLLSLCLNYLLSLVLCLTQHTGLIEINRICNRLLPEFHHNSWALARGLSKPSDNPFLSFCCHLILAWGKIPEFPQSRFDILFPVISFLHSAFKLSPERAVYLISWRCVSQLKNPYYILQTSTLKCPETSAEVMLILDVQEVSKPQQSNFCSPLSVLWERTYNSINLEPDECVCFPNVPPRLVPFLRSSSMPEFSGEREINSVCSVSRIRFQFAVRTLIKTLIDQLYHSKLSVPLLLQEDEC